MATDLRNLPAFIGDDATFRTWGSGIAAQLAAVGLVQTANTGQINWTTVLRPAASTYAGYEMWRFNDTLQATKPVFLKVEYGVHGTPDRPRLGVTVGTATNGAGTITGQVGATRLMIVTSSKSAGVTLPSYCSGSSSRLSLCTNLDAASVPFVLMHLVERTKTSAGVETGDGIVAFSVCNANFVFQVLPFSGTIPASVAVNMAASLSSGGASVVGTSVAISPTIAPLGKIFYASWAAYLHADLTELISVSADHLGASRTMMPLGDGVTIANIVQGDATGHSLAMLWE